MKRIATLLAIIFSVFVLHIDDIWAEVKSEETIIAVLDTGADFNLPDLSDNIWVNKGEVPDTNGDGKIDIHDVDYDGDGYISPGELALISDGKDNDGNGYIDDVLGWNFEYDEHVGGLFRGNDPRDDNDHGTFQTGIIVAIDNNSICPKMVGWNVKIMVLKVANRYGYVTDWRNITRAIKYASEKGARVINISLVSGTGVPDACLQETKKAIDKSPALIVCSAGGGGPDRIGYNIDHLPVYPASFKSLNIITVASSDVEGSLSPPSNYGAKSVDVATPGERILSTVRYSGCIKRSGTSAAASQVSRTAGQIFDQNPSLTNIEVKEIIEGSVTPKESLKSKVATGGVLNAEKALARALSFTR